jgi:hypothetical protein
MGSQDENIKEIKGFDRLCIIGVIAQARRAASVRHGTDAQSRRCLKQPGSAA